MVQSKTYFVAQTTLVAAPSDANDGQDRFGFGLTTASWTASTKTITQSGAFAGYTWSSGDEIYLSHASIQDGLYEIASRTDDDSIVLVDEIHASDQTNVASSNGPWLTVDHGFNTVVNQQTLRICDDGTYTAAAQLAAGWGVSTVPVQVSGASLRGALDGSRPTISAASLGGTTDLILCNSTGRPIFRDLILTGGGGGQHLLNNGTNSVRPSVWIRCQFTDSQNDGVYATIQQSPMVFIDCEMDNNAGNGLSANTSGRGVFQMHRCRIHNNAGYGVLLSSNLNSAQGHLVECLVYKNTGAGVYHNTGSSDGAIIINRCTIDGNGGDGVDVDSNYGYRVITNTAITNNGGYGISWAGSVTGSNVVESSLFYNNTSGDFSHETLVEFDPTHALNQNIFTLDPLYTSTVNGSEDYTPLSNSALIAAGIGVEVR